MSDLVDVLKPLGLPDYQLQVIAETWPDVDAQAWRAGLDQIALTVLLDERPAPPGPETEPWRAVFAALHSVNGTTPLNDVIVDALGSYSVATQIAAYDAICLAATAQERRYQGVRLGSKIAPGRAAHLLTSLLEGPDPDLRREVKRILTDKLATAERQTQLEEILLGWLQIHGRFVRTPEDGLYYLWRDKHELYEMDTDRWHAWLHVLTGVNPVATVFGVLTAACKTMTWQHGERVHVVRLAHWDNAGQVLRVSQFNGSVWLCDGNWPLGQEANGDGPVIFDDMALWETYEPDWHGVENMLADVPERWGHWENSYHGHHAWAFRVWLYSLFFSEQCPTKPLLLLLGEKGSGKSLILRLALQFLFGRFSQVSGMPDKPDAFAVAASHYHLYVIDNVDEVEAWVRDKLARITTGATDEYRKLYTSKELGIITYRCWLAMTARTPDMLRRDDLADRLLILPLERVPDVARQREYSFLQIAAKERNGWWADVLRGLNRIVAELRDGQLPTTSPLRMADWEMFGRAVSRAHDKEWLWDVIVAGLKGAQATFLSDGEIVLEAIDRWLSVPTNLYRSVTARQLYTETQELLFGLSKPDADWPRSAKSFGRRLMNVKDHLANMYGLEMVFTRSKVWEYRFSKRP